MRRQNKPPRQRATFEVQSSFQMWKQHVLFPRFFFWHRAISRPKASRERARFQSKKLSASGQELGAEMLFARSLLGHQRIRTEDEFALRSVLISSF